MKTPRLLSFALLATVLAGCGDSPGRVAAPTGPSLASAGDCEPAGFTSLNPQNASVTQGQNIGFTAGVRGEDSGGSLCSITDVIAYAWSVSNTGLAQVGQTNYNGPTASATIHGLAPGTVQVTVRAWTARSDTVSRTTSLTIVAATPTPAVSAIAGPTTVSASGTYSYSVTASGGNNTSYSYTWEARHSGGNWAVVHTASGGPSSTASIGIVGGRLYEVRVKVTSGTSATATSPVLTVDARGAASPLGVELSGYDNIRTTGVHTFEAMPTGGASGYTYAWTLRRSDGSVAQGTGKTFSINFPTCAGPDYYDLDVVVTSGAETASTGTVLNVEIYSCE
jgi:hypothetical protein